MAPRPNGDETAFPSSRLHARERRVDFPAGTTTETVTVQTLDDHLPGPTRDFEISKIGASTDAQLPDDALTEAGVCRILDDHTLTANTIW